MPGNAAYTPLEAVINFTCDRYDSSSLFSLPIIDFQSAHDDLLSSLTLTMQSELS